MSLLQIQNSTWRICYIVAMFTGLRAVFNWLQSRRLTQPKTVIVDGQKRKLSNGELLYIRVHARPAVSAMPTGSLAGMISISLASPGISALLYGFLKMTSHLGCGHIEIAFYETNDSTVIHGIRNIVDANARRIGWKNRIVNLQLSKETDLVEILKFVKEFLGQHGLEPLFASPADCVKLSVTNSLVDPTRNNDFLFSLERKYERMWKKAGVVSISKNEGSN